MDAAWAESDVIIERRIVNHRTAGTPIEPRVCIADYRGGQLTLHLTSQNPHLIRLFMAGELEMGEDSIRVIAPDVGGGFGVKITHYPEEILAAWASRKLGRPVKWTETRSEHMSSSIHGRDQIDFVKVGAKRDGTIVGLECTAIADFGAFYTLLTPFIPSFTGFVISGCYKIPNLKFTAKGVFTNKMATDATRGAGRPEATHLIEVMVEQLAAELGMDSLELRRKNFIPKEDFPAEVAIGIVYDSGDYHGSLDKLLTHVDVDAFRARAGGAAEPGQVPRHRLLHLDGDLRPRAVAGRRPERRRPAGGLLRVRDRARARVGLGDRLHRHRAARPGARHRVRPDRRRPPGHHARRWSTSSTATPAPARSASAPTARARWPSAASRSPARPRRWWTRRRRSSPTSSRRRPRTSSSTDGKFAVKGSPDKAMTIAEIAGGAYIPENLPEGMEPGLEETMFYDPENFVFPFGAHACIVDVDVETGKVDIVRYVAVDDCGPAINPKLIDGQIHGGITHAIGQALYERIHYDDDGQLVTGTFVDYALPSAADVPSFETDRTETPSPVNSLGVKGVGEAGTIAASPAIVNAVIDALRPLGVDFIDMPLSPQNVWATIQEAKGRDVPQDPGKQGGSGTSTGAAAPAPDRPRRVREVGCDPRRVRLRRARARSTRRWPRCATAARTRSSSPAGTRCCR